MLKKFLLTWLVNFLGLWVAAAFFSGIQYQGGHLRVLVIASLIFGLVNAFLRPLIVILSLPAIVLTLGVFTLFINALMLYLTSVLYPSFSVTSVWAAIGAVITVWLINYLMSDVLGDSRESQRS